MSKRVCRAGWLKLVTGSQAADSHDEMSSSGHDEQQRYSDDDNDHEQVPSPTVVYRTSPAI